MTRPLFTIVVAVRNGARTIQECLDSVAGQSFAGRELIVIDGGSSDGTAALLERNRDRLAHWVSEPDGGIHDAWNKALARAGGEWILFLGADDRLWDAGVLERAAAALAALPGSIRVAYGRVMLLSAAGEPLHPIGEPWTRVKPRLLQDGWLPHQATFHRRALFERHGNFDTSYRIAGDYEMLLRELAHGDAAFLPDLLVSGMRQGGVSSDPASALRLLREYGRAQRSHGRGFPGPRRWVVAGKVYGRLALWALLGERRARRALDCGRRLRGLPAYWTRA